MLTAGWMDGGHDIMQPVFNGRLKMLPSLQRVFKNVAKLVNN